MSTSFKHYYFTNAIGSGSIKFKRYSQTRLKLYAPVLTIDGDTVQITCGDYALASGITISAVKSSGGVVTSTTLENTTTSYKLPGSIISDSNTGTYYITAVTEANAPYITSDVSNRVSYTLNSRISTPQNVTLNGKVITWDKVTGASSYNVYVDNVLYTNTTGTMKEEIWQFDEHLSETSNIFSGTFKSNGNEYVHMVRAYDASTDTLSYYDANNTKTVVYYNGSWTNQTYRIVEIKSGATSRWFAQNATSITNTVSYDVTTNDNWDNLISGNHTFAITALGSGYRESLMSSSVIVNKAA